MYNRLQAELQAQVGNNRNLQELLNNAAKFGRGPFNAGRGRKHLFSNDIVLITQMNRVSLKVQLANAITPPGGKNGGGSGGRGDFSTRQQGGKRGGMGGGLGQGGGGYGGNARGNNRGTRGGSGGGLRKEGDFYNYDREPVRADPVLEQLFSSGEYLKSGRLLEVSKDQLGCRLMQGRRTICSGGAVQGSCWAAGSCSTTICSGRGAVQGSCWAAGSCRVGRSVFGPIDWSLCACTTTNRCACARASRARGRSPLQR